MTRRCLVITECIITRQDFSMEMKRLFIRRGLFAVHLSGSNKTFKIVH